MNFNDRIFKYFDAPADKGGDSNKKEEDVIVEDIIDTSTDVDEFDAKLDDLQDEEFELNEFPKAEEESPSKTPDTSIKDDKPDKVDEDDKPKPDDEGIKTEDAEIKDEEKETPEKPPAPDEKDKVDEQDKGLLLTDELISKFDLSEDERKYLEKFKGKNVAELAKSFANASKLIGKKKEELLKTIEPPKTELSTIPPSKPKTEQEIESAKDELIFNELSKQFPDLPKDKDERKKWLNDLGYDDYKSANKFVQQEIRVEKEIEQIWDYTEKLNRNAPQINKKVMETEIDNIKNYFSNEFQIDPKLLGYDFTIDEEGNNPVLDVLLAADDDPNKFDPTLIQNVNGVKILKQGELAQKFFRRELPKIIKEMKSQTRREVIESLKDKKVAPSLSSQSRKGTEKKELAAGHIKQINNVDQLDALLDEEDAKHFK